MFDHHSAPPALSEGPEVVRPAIDDCAYRLLTLENGLRALLVHDPEAEKAAAACDVRVGSLSDPPDVAGLAHFTEHMLFYSSEKYPEEDEYSKYVSEHGGHTNAYTSAESTNYHFDVNWDALEPALDRFAQFFICPLISADGVDREAKAVDSEHGKNLNSDPWRKLQLWKATANQGHPFSRFSTGNFETLITQPKAAGLDPHERVKAFHREHYSAGVMRLAVVSRHSLDALEALVRAKFSAVPTKPGVAPPSFPPDAVSEAQSGLLIRMVPEREGHSLELQWPTLPEQQHYRAAPSHYASHLLGHEGAGSAYALLKERGWATALVAGEAGTSFSSCSFFMVRIDLTDEGQAHVAEAVAILFRYLDLLRQPGGVNEEVWREMRQLADMRFNFRDKAPPYSYASSLSHAMQVFRDSDLLLGSYSVPLDYDPDLIAQVIADLTPERARVLWASKSLEPECTQQEAWYGTKYSAGPLPPAWLREWKEGPALPQLHLPHHNPFIPQQFDLLKESAAQPSLLHATPLVRLWHRADPSFRVPKAVLHMHLQLPESYCSPEAAVLTHLYCKLVNDYLSEVTYPAELAGLHYGLRATTAGLMLTVYGYSDTATTLAQTVLNVALSFQVRPDRFEVVKEEQRRNFANMKYDQPYQYALYCLGVLMEARRWHVADYETVLPELGADRLEAFFPRLLSRCQVEMLAAGNLDAAAATQFAQQLEAALRERCGTAPSLPAQLPDQRVVRLAAGRPALLALPGPNLSNDNSAAVVAFQVGPDDLKLNVLAELVTAIGRRDVFHQLRTVEQLGYITLCTAYWTLHVRSILFIVQSTAHGAAYLESRIEAFLPALVERLEGMAAEEFGAHVEELAKSKAEAPKRLREAAGRDWGEIDQGSLRFDRVDAEVAALRALSRAEVAAFYREHVLHPGTRRKVSVHIDGHRNPAAAAGDAATAAEGGGSKAGVLQAAPALQPVADASAAAGNEGGAEPAVELIGDLWGWKRRQELWGGFK